MSISVLIKPASGLCNMHCDYCFYKDETSKREEASYGMMDLSTLKNVIRRTLPTAKQNASFAFQGGEPLLRGKEFFKEVVRLQKQYNTHHVPIQNALQTNGTLLDEEWCQFFKENHFLIGISVDGLPFLHDAYRHLSKSGDAQETTPSGDGTGIPKTPSPNGGSAFQKTVEKIHLLEKTGVDFNILTVVNGQVAQHAKEIYGFYKQQGWRYQQYIACLDPLGEEVGKRPYSLSPKAYGQFLIDLFDCWEADVKKGTQPYIRQFENYAGIMLGYLPESCDMRGVCSVQTVVEADGSAYPCDFYMLDDYRLGNLNTDRMEVISERRKAIGFIEKSKDLPKDCATCPYFRLCRGGCQRHRVGDEEEKRNLFCESFRMFFEACLPRFEALVKLYKRS